MNKTINTAKMIFVGIFLVAAAGIWAYQIYYVQPRLKCEEAQGWWSNELRRCEMPVSLRRPVFPHPLPPIPAPRPAAPPAGS
jgi:hypothetical protein